MLFQSLFCLLKQPIVLNIPNLESLFVNHLSFFLSRMKMFSSSKVDAKALHNAFLFLLIIRIYPNSERGRKFSSLAQSLRFPGGYQSAVKLIPLDGYFLSIKGVQVKLELDKSYFTSILVDSNESEFLSSIFYLSKELVNGRNTCFEKFDSDSMLSNSKNFVLDSFFCKVSDDSRFYINNLNPEMKMGTAFSLIFKISVDEKDETCLSRLLGCICYIIMDSSHIHVNEVKAIEIIFKVEDKEGANSSNQHTNFIQKKTSRKEESESLNDSMFKTSIGHENMSFPKLIKLVARIIHELNANKNSDYTKGNAESSLQPT